MGGVGPRDRAQAAGITVRRSLPPRYRRCLHNFSLFCSLFVHVVPRLLDASLVWDVSFLPKHIIQFGK